jgi:hypothetical protein
MSTPAAQFSIKRILRGRVVGYSTQRPTPNGRPGCDVEFLIPRLIDFAISLSLGLRPNDSALVRDEPEQRNSLYRGIFVARLRAR